MVLGKFFKIDERQSCFHNQLMELDERMDTVLDKLPEDVDVVIIDQFMLISFQKDYEDELAITQIIQLAAANPTGLRGFA